MLKKLDKCLKCNNTCKIETETEARLMSCKKYLSKRSVEVKKEKGKINIPLANYNQL